MLRRHSGLYKYTRVYYNSQTGEPMTKCKECGFETKNEVFCSVKCSCIWNNTNAMTKNSRIKQGKNNGMGLKTPENIFDVSSRTKVKILGRLGVGCSNCGWNSAACDLHHIIPKRLGGTNSHDNLTILCPNCHRLAHSNKLHSFVSLLEQVGETWRTHYLAHE